VGLLPTVLPLRDHPRHRPDSWAAAAAYPWSTVIIDVDNGPGSGRDPGYTTAISRLADAGARLLGYVDLAYATRPVRSVIDDINRWAGYPVGGLFLDHVPRSPFALGPVATAAQSARRAGLPDLVLNPGTPPDPVYRQLNAQICVFDGLWAQYRQWSASGASPGDGHLVAGVPPSELDRAGKLLAKRGAALGVVLEPISGPRAAAAAGSSGRRTRTGS
jgi:hypothetical protein